MTDDDVDVDEIRAAEREADEVLHFAVLQFTAMFRNQNKNMFNVLLGLEMALLRHASRVALTARQNYSGQTKAKFTNLARATFSDVARYRAKEAKEKSRKVTQLTVVK